MAKQNGCEAVVEESAGSSVLKYGGISVGVILVLIILGLVITRLRSDDGEDKDWNQGVNMPDMSAQPVMPNMYAQPAMPDMSAQPAYAQYQQPVATQPAMPDMTAQPAYTQYQQPSAQPVVQAASPNLAALPGNQAVAPQPAAPATPTMYDVGTMRSDGNEWLEYPASSGAWYMRDATTRQWVRKI